MQLLGQDSLLKTSVLFCLFLVIPFPFPISQKKNKSVFELVWSQRSIDVYFFIK